MELASAVVSAFILWCFARPEAVRVRPMFTVALLLNLAGWGGELFKYIAAATGGNWGLVTCGIIQVIAVVGAIACLYMACFPGADFGDLTGKIDEPSTVLVAPSVMNNIQGGASTTSAPPTGGADSR
jgi:hypothetical protein